MDELDVTSDFDAALSFYSVMGDYTSVNVTYGKTQYSIMQGDRTPCAVIRHIPPGAPRVGFSSC